MPDLTLSTDNPLWPVIALIAMGVFAYRKWKGQPTDSVSMTSVIQPVLAIASKNKALLSLVAGGIALFKGGDIRKGLLELLQKVAELIGGKQPQPIASAPTPQQPTQPETPPTETK